MSLVYWPSKYPADELDYTLDWADPEKPTLAVGETISTVAWTVPAGLTEAPQGNSNTDTTSTIWLTGGTSGEVYRVSCSIETSTGRDYQADAIIEVL